MDLTDLLGVFIRIAHAAESGAHGAVAEPSVLGTLGINWTLLIAQLVNFGIVLFVLWKWVFTPVSKKLAERSEKISLALKDAEDIEQEKQIFNEWKETQMAEAREEAYKIIAEAKKEAEALKSSILDQTKKEQSKIVEQSKKEIHEEAENSTQAIKTEIASLVVSATEKILKHKVDSGKDKDIIHEAITDTLK